jgi:hypothetical protein
MLQEQPDFTDAPSVRYSELPERVRVCLALAAAGLAGLAALSPEAHTAVEGSLSNSLSSGLASDGALAAFMTNLLGNIRASGSDAAATRHLEDALIAKALGLPDAGTPAARFG